MNLPTLAIKRPVSTLMFFIALGVLGVISYSTLPVQLVPNYIYPKMFVIASYPGASPEKVEEDHGIQSPGESHQDGNRVSGPLLSRKLGLKALDNGIH